MCVRLYTYNRERTREEIHHFRLDEALRTAALLCPSFFYLLLLPPPKRLVLLGRRKRSADIIASGRVPTYSL
jgi:hypothetical protein